MIWGSKRCFLGVVIAAVACADAAGPRGGGIVELRVAPSQANPRLTRWTDNHVIWIDSAAPGSVVLVMLPGTNGVPANARRIGSVAAEQGYRAIGLMYADDLAVLDACAVDPDPDCMERMRAEISFGESLSPWVDVSFENSIAGRLLDLLRYLDRTRPTERWNQFVDGATVRWARVAVSGLSQGGGHAAYLAKVRLVARVIMFGAPADGFDGASAPWMQLGATPVSRYYGFRHARDPFRSIDANWRALGLEAFGAARSTDTGDDFGGSHMLITDALPATGSYLAAHPSVYADGVTPLDLNGSPRFAAAWRYLFGRP